MLGFGSYIKTGCEVAVKERIRAFLFEKIVLRAEEIFVLYTSDNVGKLKSDLYKKIDDWFEKAEDEDENATKPTAFPEKWSVAAMGQKTGKEIVEEAKDEYYVALDIYEESLQAYESFKKYYRPAGGIDFDDPLYLERFYSYTPLNQMVEGDGGTISTFTWYLNRMGTEFKKADDYTDNLDDDELMNWFYGPHGSETFAPVAMGFEHPGSGKCKHCGFGSDKCKAGKEYAEGTDFITGKTGGRNKLRCASTYMLKNLQLKYSKRWNDGHRGTANYHKNRTGYVMLKKQLDGKEYNAMTCAVRYCTAICDRYDELHKEASEDAQAAMDNAYSNLKFAAHIHDIQLPIGDGFIDELKRESKAEIMENKVTAGGNEKVAVEVTVSPYKMYLYAAAVIEPRDEKNNKLKPDIKPIESKLQTWQEEEGLIKCTTEKKGTEKVKVCEPTPGLTSLERLGIRKKIAVKLEAEGKMKLRAVFRKETIALLAKLGDELEARGIYLNTIESALKGTKVNGFSTIEWLELRSKKSPFDLQIIDPGTAGELITYKETVDSMLYDLISSVGV